MIAKIRPAIGPDVDRTPWNAELYGPMKLLPLLFTFVGTAIPVHDSFVSICTLRHNTDASTLEITWRMTTHDVEHALLPVAGRSLQLGTALETPEADSLLGAYLLEHLRLVQGDSLLRLRYLGKEVEMETLYGYLQVDGVDDPEGLFVTCSLLFDMFAEQQNIVHLETDSGISSHTFVPGGAPFTFTLPQ